jgi:hypothetical protein
VWVQVQNNRLQSSANACSTHATNRCIDRQIDKAQSDHQKNAVDIEIYHNSTLQSWFIYLFFVSLLIVFAKQKNNVGLSTRWESFEFLLTTKRLIEHEVMKPRVIYQVIRHIKARFFNHLLGRTSRTKRPFSSRLNKQHYTTTQTIPLFQKKEKRLSLKQTAKKT